MFTHAILTATLIFLASSTYANPVPSTLPPGFEPTTRDEMFQRMNTSSIKALEECTDVNYIYLCTGDNYTGTCGAKAQKINQCIILKPPFLRHTYSFGLSGPDQGALCLLTAFSETETCTPNGDVTVLYPGSGALRNYVGVDVGDHLTSFVCQSCMGCT